jgi:hypothetical protein
VDEDARLRTLHELIEQAVKLQQDSQKLVAELTRQLDSVREIADKVDRRKKPRPALTRHPLISDGKSR